MRRDLELQASRSIRWSFGFWILFFAAMVIQRLGPQLLGIDATLDAEAGTVMVAAGLLAVNCILIATVLHFFARSLTRKAMTFELVTTPRMTSRQFR